MGDDKPPSTVEELMAARQHAKDQLRDQLGRLDLDGPFDFPTGGGFGDVLGSLFGGSPARNQFAICLLCGSIVVLNDPEDLGNGGPPIERGVRLHTTWHEEVSRG